MNECHLNLNGIIPFLIRAEVKFTFGGAPRWQIGAVYRINIYALALARQTTGSEEKAVDLESKELHAKLVLNENFQLELYKEEQK